jgi:cytochrome c
MPFDIFLSVQRCGVPLIGDLLTGFPICVRTIRPRSPDRGKEPMMPWISAVTRRLAAASALVFTIVLATGAARAEDLKPTPDEVVDLTRRAVAIVETQGVEAAREIFNREGEFKFGEIYVNLLDFKGAWLIYPPRPASVGLNVINLKDADGKSLIQDIIKTARDSGEGWVEYRWINPVSNKVEPKLTYVKRVVGKDIAASIGIYK